jgi:hypothetical protein
MSPRIRFVGAASNSELLVMTDEILGKLETGNWCCKEGELNKPNAVKTFDINRMQEKGRKQTQWRYPQLHQYVAGISALILKKYEWTAGLCSISDLSYLPWYQLVTITSPAIFGKY